MLDHRAHLASGSKNDFAKVGETAASASDRHGQAQAQSGYLGGNFGRFRALRGAFGVMAG